MTKSCSYIDQLFSYTLFTVKNFKVIYIAEGYFFKLIKKNQGNNYEKYINKIFTYDNTFTKHIKCKKW